MVAEGKCEIGEFAVAAATRVYSFDFGTDDTAVFPDNSGYYIENTSETQNLT